MIRKGYSSLISLGVIALLMSVLLLPSLSASMGKKTPPLKLALSKVDYKAGEGPNSVAVTDLDGDGLDDLVMTNVVSNTVSVLLNTSHR
ncbi:FG-GAP repeat protein [bacterium]|nr:FG-GAP repeat protein [bacterium]